MLLSFRCTNDDDIQDFLHHKAMEFEKIAKSRTYLIIDQEQLEEPYITLDKVIVYGYISLQLKYWLYLKISLTE